MKILGVHSVRPETYTTAAPVDLWRIYRPLRELAKHKPDWVIDHQPTLIDQIESLASEKDFTPMELERAAAHLGQYDVVFTSYYHLGRADFTLMLAVTKRYGTQFIVDIDDDLGSVNPDNPIWLTATKERIQDLQIMSVVTPWVSTNTPVLAHRLRNIRHQDPMGSVFMVPNYISDDYQHPPLTNGPIVVGYFGGSSHFADLNDSGFPKAMRDIMRKYKHVDFRACGVPLDTSMPAKRESFLDSSRGEAWVRDIYPQLRMDIVVTPLLSNPFNEAKSNIKWQEATRMGAAVIASRFGPYRDLGDVAYLTSNTRAAWYEALEYMVLGKELRRQLVERAQANLFHNWRLEDHWQPYADMFEHVASAKPTNMQ